MAQVLGVVKSA